MDGSVQDSRAFCKCNICKETFNDIESLEMHIMDIHRFKQLKGAPVTKVIKCEVKADPEFQKDDNDKQIILGEAVSQKIEPKLEISTKVVDFQSQIGNTLKIKHSRFYERSNELQMKDQSHSESLVEAIDHNKPVAKHHCSVCRKECRISRRLPVRISLLKRKEYDHMNLQSTSKSKNITKRENNLKTSEKTKHRINEATEIGSVQGSNESQSKLDLKKTSVTKHRCVVCKKEFVHKSYLDIHIKVDHENIKEFKCDQCPKSFGAEEYLKRHKSRVHSKSG